MSKITPHLWFDKEAKEAAHFYCSIFPNSKVTNITTLHDTPSGDCDVVSFELAGQPFMAISAGPLFKFNPSVSFLVVCKTKQEVDDLWAKLSKGGNALMGLGEYPFSQRYGWTTDKYGLSWQIMLASDYPFKHKIKPTWMFVGDICGKAEEAMKFYASIFPASQVGGIARYPAGMEPDKVGTVMHGAVTLAGQEFFAMDSARKHNFGFNESISFMINCDTQKEIDHFWEKLSAVPEAEVCGWLKDKYGLSWQVVPASLGDMMRSGTQEQVARVTQAFLQMKKFDIAQLKKAYQGE